MTNKELAMKLFAKLKCIRLACYPDELQGKSVAAIEAALDLAVKDAVESKEFSRDWWAARFKRLEDFARAELSEELKTRFFSIVANGTAEVWEPPTYDRILAMQKHEIEALRKQLEGL